MKLEEALKLGDPMVRTPYREIARYDGPLIGTFQLEGRTVLFWTADTYYEWPRMRFSYVELTDEEVANLNAYFQPGGSNQNHPLLTGRRVVVGLSDHDVLAQLAVIEQSSDDVFAEIDQLFPQPQEASAAD